MDYSGLMGGTWEDLDGGKAGMIEQLINGFIKIIEQKLGRQGIGSEGKVRDLRKASNVLNAVKPPSFSPKAASSRP